MTKPMRLKRNNRETGILVAPHDVERCVLELCGGGYSVAQTRDAMLVMDKLRAGETVKRHFWIMSLEDVEVVPTGAQVALRLPGEPIEEIPCPKA